MKVILERIQYRRLRNDEFVLVVIYIIDICGKYDNKKLHLDKSYGELFGFRSVLESIKVYVRKNEKINYLNQLDVERDILIICANGVVDAYHGVQLPDIMPHYDVLVKLLTKHQTKTIAKDTRTAETERLQKLEAEVNASPAIQAALKTFNLQPVVTRLFAANKEYDALFKEYIAEKSTEERVDMIDLRKRCTKALGQYFDAVQYCAFAHEENDYQPLINELAQLSAYYNQQLKARATRLQNDKKSTDESIIEPPTTNYTSY